MLHPITFRRVAAAIALVLLPAWLAQSAVAQIEFELLEQNAIDARLSGFSKNNAERESILKRWFADSGCKPENLTEQLVKNKSPPNVICVLPGKTDRVILVGAHTDHAEIGDGVVDNWSGASLLPSLLYGLSHEPRQHTFVFVGFAGEERECWVPTFTPPG